MTTNNTLPTATIATPIPLLFSQKIEYEPLSPADRPVVVSGATLHVNNNILKRFDSACKDPNNRNHHWRHTEETIRKEMTDYQKSIEKILRKKHSERLDELCHDFSTYTDFITFCKLIPKKNLWYSIDDDEHEISSDEAEECIKCYNDVKKISYAQTNKGDVLQGAGGTSITFSLVILLMTGTSMLSSLASGAGMSALIIACIVICSVALLALITGISLYGAGVGRKINDTKANPLPENGQAWRDSQLEIALVNNPSRQTFFPKKMETVDSNDENSQELA